jgi:hypothetical protein
MKHSRIHLPKLSYIAAFVIGVIFFAAIWKVLFGSVSSRTLIAGTGGVAVAVIVFWLWDEFKNSRDSDG